VALPYWRLSAYYFFYFASLGALVPFWGPYLKSLGFGPLAIGQLIAIFMATKLVAPNLAGWIADRRGHRLTLVRLSSLATLICFAGVFAARGFWGQALVMALFSFFWNASLPQLEAITFNHLGGEVRRYARIRLWGSVGFILAVGSLGLTLEHRPIALLPWVVLILFGGIWLAALAVPEAPASTHPQTHTPALARLLRRPEILAFLFACLAMQASHGAYYGFYSLYLQEHGYAKGLIGGLWALGVVAEVGLFLVMQPLLRAWGARRVLILSLLLAVVRWLLIGGFPDLLAVLVPAQLLHAATFGGYHAAAIHLVHHYFPGRVQGRGQALYASLSFGAGGAIGTFFSGWAWGPLGGRATFALASLAALAGALVAWRWVDRAGRY